VEHQSYDSIHEIVVIIEEILLHTGRNHQEKQRLVGKEIGIRVMSGCHKGRKEQQ